MLSQAAIEKLRLYGAVVPKSSLRHEYGDIRALAAGQSISVPAHATLAARRRARKTLFDSPAHRSHSCSTAGTERDSERSVQMQSISNTWWTLDVCSIEQSISCCEFDMSDDIDRNA